MEDTTNPSPQVDINAWVTSVKRQLDAYPDGQRIEAVNFLYVETYNDIEAKVEVAKANTSLLEKTFSKLIFKVNKNQ
jgi:hypothetical protein